MQIRWVRVVVLAVVVAAVLVVAVEAFEVWRYGLLMQVNNPAVPMGSTPS